MLVRIKRDKDLTGAEQSKMTGYIWFFVAAAVFWMIYDQGGSTLSALRRLQDRRNTVLGWDFPASWYQSVNPLFDHGAGPGLRLAVAVAEPAGPGAEHHREVRFGLVLVGASFFVFLAAAGASPATAQGQPDVAGRDLLRSRPSRELCLSPVGLSVTTKMAPAKYASQMMGVWFLAVTAGDCVFAIVQLVIGDAASGKTGFAVQGVIAALAGVVFLAARNKIRPLLGSVK